MYLFKSYNLLEGSKTALRLNWGALVLFILLLATAWVLTDRLQVSIKHLTFATDALLFFGGYLGVTLLHEAVHALFFKAFAPGKKLVRGVKNGFSHVTSPKSRYTKGQFIWITLAPFVLLSMIGGVLMAVFGVYFWLGLLLITHGASCIGDFYLGWRLRKAPKTVMIEATSQGIDLYLPQVK